jgi:hypothetical protein
MRRTATITVAIVAAVLCLGSPMRADDIVAISDDEISGLFSAFCLQSFPDPSALDRLAAAKHAVAMKPEEVASLLHGDPGRGWFLRTSALFAVTIESPPYLTCAVRRMTPSGVSGVKNYIAAVNAYVAGKQGKLTVVPVQKSNDKGVDISIYGYAMADASGNNSENFAVVLSNYHGRANDRWRPDAGAGVGVEVRMVHQLLKR